MADEETDELERAEVSRRLKAARWLAGGVDAKGKPTPLSPQELAERDPLKRNRITANAVMEIEQLVRTAREMELHVIAKAMNLPDTWFGDMGQVDLSVGSLGTGKLSLFQVKAVQEALDPLERRLETLSRLVVDALSKRADELEVRSLLSAGEDLARRSEEQSSETKEDPPGRQPKDQAG